jgi:UTP--glucose-1-phosphate uridylyltransferase
MLPLVDKPVIQYVVEEAVCAGVENVILVTGRGKQAIENHFDVAIELEILLSKRKNDADLETIRSITNLANFSYVRQGEPLGLGHAVLCAKHAVGGEAFGLLLGDDVFDGDEPALNPLIQAYCATGKSVVGIQQVPIEHVHRYGIVNKPQSGDYGCWRVDTIVEKPQPNDAPSQGAVVGRYILSPEIFGLLESLAPGAGGEYQLTDALSVLARKGDLVATTIPAKRYDTGDKLDYLRANIELALKRDELGDQFLSYLRKLVGSLD